MGPRKQLKPTHSAAGSRANSVSNKSSAPVQLTEDDHSTAGKPSSEAGWTAKSWPRGQKAAAVTEVARESISAAGHLASELVASTTSLPEIPKPLRSRSIQLTKITSASSRSLPADATTTRINIASSGSPSTAPDAAEALQGPSVTRHDAGKSEEKVTIDVNTDSKGADETQDQSKAGTTEGPRTEPELATQQRDSRTSLLGWFGWSAPMADKSNFKERDLGESTGDDKPKPASAETPEASGLKDNVTEAVEEPEGAGSASSAPQARTTLDTSIPQKRAWIQMWGGANSKKAKENPQENTSNDHSSLEPDQAADQPMANTETHTDSQTEQLQRNDTSKRNSGLAKPSGWAFWSKETPKVDSQPGQQNEESGELVLSGEPPAKTKLDENIPRADSRPTSPAASKVIKEQSKVAQSPKSTKNKSVKNTGSVTEGTTTSSTTDDTITAPMPAKVKSQEVTASRQLQSVLTNQLLPAFKDTFALQESASWLQTLGRLLHYTKEPENHHVFVLRDPPRPKKALAIGVHGYFPAPYLRTVLGQPTGTSLKFSTMAAKAIHRWAESHGYHCDVEKIALEGEGRIAERVDLLWKLLLGWMDDIRKAEFIIFACHSQGVPVTIMLVAKLIAFGCLDATRVGICAMAGVNLGPFPDYKSRWIGGSAGELFDFANPTTKVSKDYEAALKTCLDFGVRITYIGSIDDQLVSLESSLFDPITHPYIYRAVFVDGKVHAPSFLSHLVGFTLKLRNLGIQDHGLIRELSAPLVGSLVGGEGHSRLHDEENIYHMAVEFALETSNVNGASLYIRRHKPASTPNPYILPFALRGLLEEDYVRHELHHESLELLRQFDEWRPTTKVLKDVKFRLEGIRSKL